MPKLAPDFVSVTYGAGGSTRQKTVDLVARIQSELEVETVPHLTCVGHSREELGEILAMLDAAGIHSIMALRVIRRAVTNPSAPILTVSRMLVN